MKVYKEVTVPQTKKKILDKTLCEICNQDVKKNDDGSIQYEYQITGKILDYYGADEYLDLDFCPTCFNNIIIPFLKSYEVDIRYNAI